MVAPHVANSVMTISTAVIKIEMKETPQDNAANSNPLVRPRIIAIAIKRAMISTLSPMWIYKNAFPCSAQPRF